MSHPLVTQISRLSTTHYHGPGFCLVGTTAPSPRKEEGHCVLGRFHLSVSSSVTQVTTRRRCDLKNCQSTDLNTIYFGTRETRLPYTPTHTRVGVVRRVPGSCPKAHLESVDHSHRLCTTGRTRATPSPEDSLCLLVGTRRNGRDSGWT